MTDVIVARQQQSDPLSAMFVWSVVAHVAFVAGLLFGPLRWGMNADEPPRTVMTISLAGAPGPRTTGMTPMAGRNVPETPPAPKPVPPAPAAAAPRPIRPAPKPRVADTPPRNNTARQPTRPQPAEEPAPGATRTETGARGQGFGLATGGAGGTGVQVEAGDFCCPEYLQQMVSLIQRNWQSKQGVRGATVMRFTITRSGTIEAVQVFQPSGFVALDLAAQQALLRTRLPELPLQYPNPTLTMRVTFEYQ